jgi:heme/copper-type cytochrome/quinol oxidase subunit 2
MLCTQGTVQIHRDSIAFLPIFFFENVRKNSRALLYNWFTVFIQKDRLISMTDQLSVGWMAAKQGRVLLLQVKQSIHLVAESRKANTAGKLLIVCAIPQRVVNLNTDVLVQVAASNVIHSFVIAGKVKIFAEGAIIS